MEFPLQQACMNNDFKTVKELVSEDHSLVFKKDSDGRVGLHWAVSFQFEPIIDYLLSFMKEMDIDDLVDDAGWTPFHIACSVGSLNTVKKLYEGDLKPNLDLLTLQGVSALHLAVSKKHLPIVEFLLNKGASVRVKDKKLQLPIHRAAAIGSMAMVDILCQKNSPVNAKDFQGWTPLFHALAEGHGDVAVLLVNKYSADYESTENSNGEKPLDVALNEQVKDYFIKNVQ
ncbi:hypothetical protein TPHA_0A05100 [Tetrapisispora phaffii CBS 4417]|uniref:Uncharacterized protein n=1 Tax=Tetrapisispora phaffii (strain ATCC 24235 / CBS 4417 / NBRC 1672 / NRRL Y-8282 / UCD 70-5) TaxID=1071381 RepID=G8BNV7_TETPH|nr:hypothetical protein TPHA_0A05100 [Tetrapisispora phaffii CBS 4417]CCE61585.1 hypothetical protein TPHA_0A05100 [Tetrapisispora phaffii CBS 4417]